MKNVIKFEPPIQSCADLANMSENDRLSLLVSLKKTQYQDIMKVLSSKPSISMEVSVEGEITRTAGQVNEGFSMFVCF